MNGKSNASMENALHLKESLSTLSGGKDMAQMIAPGRRWTIWPMLRLLYWLGKLRVLRCLNHFARSLGIRLGNPYENRNALDNDVKCLNFLFLLSPFFLWFFLSFTKHFQRGVIAPKSDASQGRINNVSDYYRFHTKASCAHSDSHSLIHCIFTSLIDHHSLRHCISISSIDHHSLRHCIFISSMDCHSLRHCVFSSFIDRYI